MLMPKVWDRCNAGKLEAGCGAGLRCAYQGVKLVNTKANLPPVPLINNAWTNDNERCEPLSGQQRVVWLNRDEYFISATSECRMIVPRQKDAQGVDIIPKDENGNPIPQAIVANSPYKWVGISGDKEVEDFSKEKQGGFLFLNKEGTETKENVKDDFYLILDDYIEATPAYKEYMAKYNYDERYKEVAEERVKNLNHKHKDQDHEGWDGADHHHHDEKFHHEEGDAKNHHHHDNEWDNHDEHLHAHDDENEILYLPDMPGYCVTMDSCGSENAEQVEIVCGSAKLGAGLLALAGIAASL